MDHGATREIPVPHQTEGLTWRLTWTRYASGSGGPACGGIVLTHDTHASTFPGTPRTPEIAERRRAAQLIARRRASLPQFRAVHCLVGRWSHRQTDTRLGIPQRSSAPHIRPHHDRNTCAWHAVRRGDSVLQPPYLQLATVDGSASADPFALTRALRTR